MTYPEFLEEKVKVIDITPLLSIDKVEEKWNDAIGVYHEKLNCADTPHFVELLKQNDNVMHHYDELVRANSVLIGARYDEEDGFPDDEIFRRQGWTDGMIDDLDDYGSIYGRKHVARCIVDEILNSDKDMFLIRVDGADQSTQSGARLDHAICSYLADAGRTALDSFSVFLGRNSVYGAISSRLHMMLLITGGKPAVETFSNALPEIITTADPEFVKCVANLIYDECSSYVRHMDECGKTHVTDVSEERFRNPRKRKSDFEKLLNFFVNEACYVPDMHGLDVYYDTAKLPKATSMLSKRFPKDVGGLYGTGKEIRVLYDRIFEHVLAAGNAKTVVEQGIKRVE